MATVPCSHSGPWQVRWSMYFTIGSIPEIKKYGLKREIGVEHVTSVIAFAKPTPHSDHATQKVRYCNLQLVPE